MEPFAFPRWTNRLRPLLAAAAGAGGLYVTALVAFGASPSTTDVGYAPKQPIAFSHALHAGDLSIDCRYCHVSVETSAQASLPTTQTCMNCHLRIRAESEALRPLRRSAATGEAIPWVKVHDLPDYVYFDHSAHVTRGVGCASCHGRVDRMEVVRQVEPLSMSWCLDCHRRPDANLRPADRVTDMEWRPPEGEPLGQRLRAERGINPSTDCSTCHR